MTTGQKGGAGRKENIWTHTIAKYYADLPKYLV